MYSQKAKRVLDRNLIFGDRGDRYEDWRCESAVQRTDQNLLLEAEGIVCAETETRREDKDDREWRGSLQEWVSDSGVAIQRCQWEETGISGLHGQTDGTVAHDLGQDSKQTAVGGYGRSGKRNEQDHACCKAHYAWGQGSGERWEEADGIWSEALYDGKKCCSYVRNSETQRTQISVGGWRRKGAGKRNRRSK